MEEVRGSPARRLSQILDPIARLATDFGSNSAPCSPRLGARGHEASGGGTIQTTGQAEVAAQRRQPEPSRGGGLLPSGAESPRLWPRQLRQAPAPPPRPRHASNANNNHAAAIQGPPGTLPPPVHGRDSPYVNVPNLLFQKQDKKGFAEAARSAGYVELRDAKPKCSPYDFTSESSGHVEYADKVRTFAAQTDFEASSACYDAKDLAAFARARSNFDPGPAPRGGPFDRAYSFSGRQPDQTGRMFAEGRVYGEQRNVVGAAAGSEAAKKEKLETRPAYGASKSFDGYSSAVEELNWQERCLELQLELHRSRSQATRVRDMLREKVSPFILLFSFPLLSQLSSGKKVHPSSSIEFTRLTRPPQRFDLTDEERGETEGKMWAARRFVSGPSRPIFSGVSGGTNRDERSVTKPISDPVPCRRRNGHCPTTFSAFPLSVSHRSPIRYFAFPSNDQITTALPMRVNACTKPCIGNCRRVDEEDRRLVESSIEKRLIEFLSNILKTMGKVEVSRERGFYVPFAIRIGPRYHSGTIYTVHGQFYPTLDIRQMNGRGGRNRRGENAA